MDYKVFVPMYDDAIISERWKSVADEVGYVYFNTFEEAKESLITYCENAISNYKVMLKKAHKLKEVE